MGATGTLINYYFHCKRQCWLHGNRINLEDNSEDVKIGKALHEVKASEGQETEIAVENIKIDKITRDYLVEIKKSDTDYEAVKWQVLFYLNVLKQKGIERRGKIEFIEKNKSDHKIYYVDLDDEIAENLKCIEKDMVYLIDLPTPPPYKFEKKCIKCAYYTYCCI
ncbi:CRISPR-associated protein Cas4 [Acetobacterium tundrae]|uniref:Dna2/Cas4 domain-containing protein n=1 Tax=Acetobacterium tundrae TaxID=132932 RepID=A0ABR6WPM7_9FIRM|nr:CRISPR-associated protein Cas4 [Acetobacterium tundrae]MBC3798261.1 Dna2/Cas4 domain-containing protein [Acetobacterium tundrae]